MQRTRASLRKSGKSEVFDQCVCQCLITQQEPRPAAWMLPAE